MNKRQYLLFICLISTLGGFLFGFDTAVISGTITLVRDQFGLSSLKEGWFVGSALLGCIIGVAFTGILADFFGRKKALILSSLLLISSAVGCTVPENMNALIVYRLIGGLGVGIASMMSPLYISEISPPSDRGKMVSLYQFAITIGILTAYFSNARLLAMSNSVIFGSNSFLGFIINREVWRAMFGSETIPGVLFFILLMIVPESPRWLMAKHREENALKVLGKFYEYETANKEIEDIKEVLKKESSSMKMMAYPGIRLALIVGILLSLLSQFTGINAIIYYGPRIFETAGLSQGSSLNGQVIIGIVNVVFTIIAIWKIDKIGRRKLLIAGCSGMMVAHIIIGFLFKTGTGNTALYLIFMMIFIAFFAFSYGPVIWTLLSEIYPTGIRGRAMSVATLTLWLGTYLVGQLVPWLFDTIKAEGTFWLFATMCLPAILIVWKLVPETKGKSLEEIEKYWLSRK
jgi:SP family arabinose:H+ symporter-like MFS transporter